MCGIAGFIDFNQKTSEDTLLKMTRVLEHRGPDDFGVYFKETADATVGLGQQRLSILDLSKHGHQPMLFNDWVIVFNGEIYNFKEIAADLRKDGYSFNSDSDTEVILKAFDKWGTKAVDRFIGMFAFVLYNQANDELLIFRDRAGVKPLYYYHNNGVFLFASELKSFHQHPAFEKEIDFDSLSLFLQFSYIPTPYSIFKNTSKLSPGHFLRINLKSQAIEMEKYWDVVDCYNQPKLDISFEDACEELEKLLISAFSYRMVADVPVGLLLSGGYDSTAVASILQSRSTEKLKTFTIGYKEESHNEAHEAKAIAEFLGTDHHEKYVTAADTGSILEKLPLIYDEPFADNSVVPTYLVSQLARSKVKVALSGDGGDELFAGYDKFNRSIALTKYPSVLQRILSGAMSVVNPDRIPHLSNGYNFSTRYDKIREIWKYSDPSRALKVISQFITTADAKKFLVNQCTDRHTYFDIDAELNNSNDALNKLLAIDYKTFLLDNNMAKMDRATMSVGLEGREPFLDHRVLEFSSRLPSEYKLKNGVNKHILKTIVHKYVPREMMERPKKPFLAPLGVWFKDELKEYYQNYLSEEYLKKDGIFTNEIVALRDDYLSGKHVNHQKLWNVLMFQLWKKEWL